ncbi:hypothetical protein [Alkalihalobacillus sp. TS-13]|uniref:hypothetical protein n=1 Tax=Alkalihalobacillus sp. TS-13 TaxID=2842455 RepID=UPI001C8670FF|nr:hypothetical protein [Alkalihalobacillus sp. TS-13]
MSRQKINFLKHLSDCLSDHPSSDIEITFHCKNGTTIDVLFDKDQNITLHDFDDEEEDEYLDDDFEDEEGIDDE